MRGPVTDGCAYTIMMNPEGKGTGKIPHIRVFNGRYIVLLLALAIIALLLVPVTAIPIDNPEDPAMMDDNNSFDLAIVVKDAGTRAGIAGARIYLDGGFQGITSGNDGHLSLFSISRGEHTLRATKSGFLEAVILVAVPDKKQATIPLQASKIIPIGNHGPEEERIDIVFVPSKTQYDCNKVEKITTDYYTAHEDNFKADVNNLIQKRFFSLDRLTSKSVGIPENYKERFNFYYYWDPDNFADAFQDCAGTLPKGFWNTAPFTDVAIIIYPTYGGYYKGPPCEPHGCASGMGPGVNAWFKNPADSGIIFMHETGHVVFGLIDTYCGPTYYTQNNPDPNVWSSQSGCIRAAKDQNWNPAPCRQITLKTVKGGAASCKKDFWRWDPDPDLMATASFSGKFGNASSLHIRYILDNINRWQL